MAKQSGGYLGGFSGKLGPVVGYMWNGKWCLRSCPPMVRNPRTMRQMEQRALFREEVRLAASMRDGVMRGLTLATREAGMTAYNLFVSLNQAAFGSAEGQLQVAWEELTLSVGPVAPVQFDEAVVDERNVLSVRFRESALSSGRRSKQDEVRVYVYCPEVGKGCLSATAYRYERQLRLMLPSFFAGHELVVYGFVQNAEGEGSPSVYIPLEASAAEEPAGAPGAPAEKKDVARSGKRRIFAESSGAEGEDEDADLQRYG